MNTNPKEVLEMRNKVSNVSPCFFSRHSRNQMFVLMCVVFFFILLLLLLFLRSESRTCRTKRQQDPSPRFCAPAVWWNAPTTRSVCDANTKRTCAAAVVPAWGWMCCQCCRFSSFLFAVWLLSFCQATCSCPTQVLNVPKTLQSLNIVREVVHSFHSKPPLL